jgi:DNA polymerase-3 subunit epsilon
MKVAAIMDTETTGLTDTDRAIEVAVMLYDLEHACPVASFASLIQSATNEAESINRIPVAILRDARNADSVWRTVASLLTYAEVVLAHRVDFDQRFVPQSFVTDKRWCCTKFHVSWPLGKPGDSLVPLALAHGVGVVSAHRAMTDVDILARLLTRVSEMGHSLPALITHAMRPRTRLAAIVGYDDRELAKAAGFAWEASTKTWWREVPDDERAALPFETRAM